MSKLVIGLIVAAVSTFLVAGPAANPETALKSKRQGRSTSLQPHPPEHTHPFIDGSLNPESISDDAAYSMFFRMIHKLAQNPDGAPLRAYLSYALRIGYALANRNDSAVGDASASIPFPV